MQLGYVGLTINLQNMRNQTIWNLIVMIVRFGFQAAQTEVQRRSFAGSSSR
jgi:hypothetical protein